MHDSCKPLVHMSNNSLWSQPTSESGHGHGQPSSPSPAPLRQHQNPTPLNPSPNPSSSATNGHSSSSITVINHSTHSSSSLHDKFEAPHQSVEYINSIKVTYTNQRHFSSASSEGAGKRNESLKRLIAPKIADRRSRTPPNQGGQTESKSSMCTHRNGEIEIIELGKVETEETKPTVNEDNPVIITEGRPKKKSRRHENCEIELLQDDLRVVVFHPDQQLVREECIEVKFVYALSNVNVTGRAGIEGEFPINIWNS